MSADQVGADEDHFHILKRASNEVDNTDKQLERVKKAKMMESQKGVFSGTMVDLGTLQSRALPAKKSKVVVFK